jgi:hypothetical protein
MNETCKICGTPLKEQILGWWRGWNGMAHALERTRSWVQSPVPPKKK